MRIKDRKVSRVRIGDDVLARRGIVGVFLFTLILLVMTMGHGQEPARADSNLDGRYGYIDWVPEGAGWVKENHVEMISFYQSYANYSVADYVTIYVAPERFNSGKYWCEYRITVDGVRVVVQRIDGSWTEGVKIRRELNTRTSNYVRNPRVYCNVYVPQAFSADPNFTGTMYLDPSK